MGEAGGCELSRLCSLVHHYGPHTFFRSTNKMSWEWTFGRQESLGLTLGHSRPEHSSWAPVSLLHCRPAWLPRKQTVWGKFTCRHADGKSWQPACCLLERPVTPRKPLCPVSPPAKMGAVFLKGRVNGPQGRHPMYAPPSLARHSDKSLQLNEWGDTGLEGEVEGWSEKGPAAAKPRTGAQAGLPLTVMPLTLRDEIKFSPMSPQQ